MNRGLALLIKDRLYVQDTGEVIQLDSYEDLVDVLFAKNLMAFTESLVPSSFPFLDACIHDEHARVVCSKKGVPTSVTIRRKNSRRWIATAKPWGWKAEPAFLKHLKEVFAYVGVGTHPTPSSLGMAYLQWIWGVNNLPNHTTPNGSAEHFIRSHLIGGRVDTPGLGQRYDAAVYYDMASAYLAKFGKQATGTAYNFMYGRVGSFADWFAHCKVQIRSELALGPFPRRIRGGKVVYPTIPGTYEAYLWKGQVENCLKVGLDVSIMEGVGWNTLTEDTQVWAESAYSLRWLAPSEAIEKTMKTIIVATIGRQGTGGSFYYLVPYGRESVGDTPVTDKVDGHGVALPYFIHEDKNENSSAMVHWYSRTLVECAMELWEFAYPYAERGKLIATNYDGVIVDEAEGQTPFLHKYELGDIFIKPGTWTWELLTNLYIKAARSYISDQVTVLPGIRRDKR